MSVYFAQRRAGGLVKIGWSRSVKVRMGAVRANVIGAIPGERETERALHERFAHLRTRGEWFRPGRDLLAYIRSEAQGHEPDSETALTGVRLPAAWLVRFDRIAKSMSEPGRRVTRLRVMRLAMHRGLVELEEEGKRR